MNLRNSKIKQTAISVMAAVALTTSAAAPAAHAAMDLNPPDRSTACLISAIGVCTTLFGLPVFLFPADAPWVAPVLVEPIQQCIKTLSTRC